MYEDTDGNILKKLPHKLSKKRFELFVQKQNQYFSMELNWINHLTEQRIEEDLLCAKYPHDQRECDISIPPCIDLFDADSDIRL